MGLKHCYQTPWRHGQGAAAAVHHQLGHGQGCGHLAGVVGVVVDHQPALPQTAEIKAPSWGLEGGYRLAQLGK